MLIDKLLQQQSPCHACNWGAARRVVRYPKGVRHASYRRSFQTLQGSGNGFRFVLILRGTASRHVCISWVVAYFLFSFLSEAPADRVGGALANDFSLTSCKGDESYRQ